MCMYFLLSVTFFCLKHLHFETSYVDVEMYTYFSLSLGRVCPGFTFVADWHNALTHLN
uniref:Uncharacterized protein n=1 Tax=Anguilla anguilla TaxID=7936 RepID=A0A0E9WH48_ANGAN